MCSYCRRRRKEKGGVASTWQSWAGSHGQWQGSGSTILLPHICCIRVQSCCGCARLVVDRGVFTEDLRRDLDTQGSKAAWAHGYVVLDLYSQNCVHRVCKATGDGSSTLVLHWDVCVHSWEVGDGAMIAASVNCEWHSCSPSSSYTAETFLQACHV